MFKTYLGYMNCSSPIGIETDTEFRAYKLQPVEVKN